MRADRTIRSRQTSPECLRQMTSPGTDTSVITWRMSLLARQSASLVTACTGLNAYLWAQAHADSLIRRGNSEALPGVVTDSAQKDKSLTEAFKPGTELR